jgi:hypothetical protein
MSKKSLTISKMARLWSGWQDSNLRSHAPKARALTGLGHTPNGRYCLSTNVIKFGGEIGTRTLATISRRQISNLLHYHSATSPLKNVSALTGCKFMQI